MTLDIRKQVQNESVKEINVVKSANQWIATRAITSK